MTRPVFFSLTHRAISLAFGLLLLPAALPAHAQADKAEAPAAAHGAEREPRMTLQASASAEVIQDTVRISLAAEIEASDQAAAGQRLSTALDEAVKRATGTAGVDVRSGGYNIWPVNDEKGKITGWRGRGEIVLESRDFAAASALASRLGDKVAISNISFLLSRQAREAEERKLLDQAAQAFRERAQVASKAFGFTGYRILRLELGGSGAAAPMPRGPMMMAAKGAAASADVPLEAGEVTVSVAVSGTIALQQ